MLYILCIFYFLYRSQLTNYPLSFQKNGHAPHHEVLKKGQTFRRTDPSQRKSNPSTNNLRRFPLGSEVVGGGFRFLPFPYRCSRGVRNQNFPPCPVVCTNISPTRNSVAIHRKKARRTRGRHPTEPKKNWSAHDCGRKGGYRCRNKHPGGETLSPPEVKPELRNSPVSRWEPIGKGWPTQPGLYLLLSGLEVQKNKSFATHP